MKTSSHPLLLVMAMLVIIMSCSHDDTRTDRQVKDFFQGITGTWQVEGENSFEEWRMGPDSGFTALAYATMNGDTLIAEHIRILKENGEWFYEATVTGQNDDRPVLFQLTEASDTVMAFQNDAHDFPQSIRYQKVDNSRMKATIAGNILGTAKTYEFNYVRIMKKKKVTGVGGIFFKAEDPEKMRNCYGENLGLVTNEYGSPSVQLRPSSALLRG